MFGSLTTVLSVVFILVFLIVAIFIVLTKLYTRASKETSYVRTGLGGQKVIMNGGSLVLPIIHEIIPVNMNTLRLEVARSKEQALITKDRMRVDVQAEFYVRVKPTADAIADAAQTLGKKTLFPTQLKELVEGKFVDALRSVAAEMRMEELHEARTDFVQRVQRAVTEDLLKNGLELETVSLTGLDQTPKEFFNPNNAFDAQGLTKLTEEIEERRKQRNDIEQDTAVAIQQKNLEAERVKLELTKEEEYARFAQEREVEMRRAEQMAKIAKERAIQEQTAQQAQISAQQEVETSEVMKSKLIELARQDESIAIAEKSREQSVAQAEADKARALAVKAQEEVATARQTEIAEREKAIELVEAAKNAEREAIRVTVAAQAEKKAAEDRALAIKTIADGEGEAEKIKADAARVRYEVEAEGKRARHAADNLLSSEQIAMQIKLALIKDLSGIIEASVKPMEAIEGIKIFQLDGFSGGAPAAGGGSSAGGEGKGQGGNLADQVVNSALRYRAQAPLVDHLLGEIGLDGGDINGLAQSLVSEVSLPKPASKTNGHQPKAIETAKVEK